MKDRRESVPPQGTRKGQYIAKREKRCGGGHGRAAIPVPQTGFKGPIPTSTSSPAPTIDGRDLPLRRIVGEPCLGDRYSGERMWNPLWGRGIGGPLWSHVRCPVYIHPLPLRYTGLVGRYKYSMVVVTCPPDRVPLAGTLLKSYSQRGEICRHPSLLQRISMDKM